MGFNPDKDYVGYDTDKIKDFFHDVFSSAQEGKIISWGYIDPLMER